MNRQTKITLGCSSFLLGLGGAAVLFATYLSGQPILAATLVGGAIGGLVGAGIGRWFVSVEGVSVVIDNKLLAAGSSVPLFAVLTGSTVIGILSQGYRPFWLGLIAAVFAFVGWVTVIQTGQNADSDEVIQQTDTLITLPTIQPFTLVDLGEYRLPFRVAVGLGITALVGATAIKGDLLFLAVALPGIFLVFPPIEQTTHVTAAGLVHRNRLGSWLPFGSTFVEWEELSGYQLEDETLTIVPAVGVSFSYECDRIDDVDEVVSILDQHLPQT